MPGYWKWEVNNASLFRYLNPPMISEVHKNNMCAYFLHNLLLSSFAKLIQTVMLNRYHDYRPKTYFTNITSQITMPWNRPCSSYQLEIFRQYARICFRKSQKISGSYLKLFGRYLRKTRGVDKNNPPPLPLIGLTRERHFGSAKQLSVILYMYDKYVINILL